MDQGKHKEIRHQGEHPEEVLADETWRSESVRETRTEQTNCVRDPDPFPAQAAGCQVTSMRWLKVMRPAGLNWRSGAQF